MKKLTIMFLMLTAVLTLISCDNVQDTEATTLISGFTTDTASAEEASNSDVTITQGDDTYIPARHSEWSEFYDENHDGWLAACGIELKIWLEDNEDPIPMLTYSDAISVDISENGSFEGISVYDSTGEYIGRKEDLTSLASLTSGEYFIAINVIWQGDYIEAWDRYERSSSEYVFFSKVESSASNESSPSKDTVTITQGDNTYIPARFLISGSDYSEERNEFLYFDGMSFKIWLKQDHEPIPTLTYSADIHAVVEGNGSLTGVTVYDGEGEQLSSESDLTCLDALGVGEYIIGVRVVWQGDYIEAWDQYERSCSEYVFLLKIEK